MSYVNYLQDMLSPLGVYDLTAISFSGAEVEATGQALEAFWQSAQVEQGEMIILTAEDGGLTKWEAVFPYRAPVETVAERRAALGGFLSISGDDFTLADIKSCLAACGVTCTLVETDVPGVVEISFEGIVGEPDNYDTVQAIITEVMPCHILVNYMLVFLSWSDAATMTWGDAADYTWHEFERLSL